VVGTCGSCGKTFQVPEAGRRYRCKACGGVVTAPRAELAAVADGEVQEQGADSAECATCGALNPAGARYCDECGEALVSGARPRAGSRRAQQRVEVGADLRRARESIGLVRAVFGVNTFVTGLWLLMLYRQLHAASLPEVPTEFWAVLAILTGMLAFSVLGFVRVVQEPFLWAVLLASFSTVDRLLYLAGGYESVVGLVIGLGWTAILWSLVPATMRVRRILREHPDHHAAQALQGTSFEARSRKRRRGSLSRSDTEELARLARRRVNLRSAVALTIVLGGSGLLAGTAIAKAPADGATALGDFVAEWNEGDLDALARRFAPVADEVGERWERLAEGPLARALPRLDPTTGQVVGTARVEAAWETEDGPVELVLELAGDTWIPVGFRPPPPAARGRAEGHPERLERW